MTARSRAERRRRVLSPRASTAYYGVMPRYYKSRYLADPIVYVQEDDRWSSYAPAGVIRQSRGELSESILAQTVEIGRTEADSLIGCRLADAERVEAQRSGSDQYPRIHDPYCVSAGPIGLGGHLALAISWLFLTILGGMILGGLTGGFMDDRPGAEMWTAGSDIYSAAWLPWMVFNSVAAFVLFFGAIAGLVLLFRRLRAGRWFMVGFCPFAIVVALVNLIMAASFGIDTLRAGGYPDEVDTLIGMQVFQMFGGIWGASFIPYFLVSTRVRGTLVRPERAADRSQAWAPVPASAAMAGAGSAPMPWAPAMAAQPAQPSPDIPGMTGGIVWRPLWPDEVAPASELASPAFCPRCGAWLGAEDRYCRSCGAMLSDGSAA